MAVNISTITRVCLYCRSNSDVEEKIFHEIYDEVGLQLQLPTLIETYFHIEVTNDGKHHLCDDCVNHLIDLYDLAEHAKEESSKTVDEKIFETIRRDATKADDFDDENIFDAKKEVEEKAHSGNHNQQNKTERINNDDNGTGEQIQSVPFTPEHIQETSQSNSPTHVTFVREQDYNEDIEYVIGDEVQNFDIEVIVNRNSSDKWDPKECEIQTSEENYQISQLSTESGGYKCIDQNSLMEENMCEESVDFLPLEDKDNDQTENNQTLDVEDVLIEEIEEIYATETNTDDEHENLYSISLKTGQENIQETVTVSFTPCETVEQLNCTENDSDQLNEHDQDEISKDNLFLEEEYLIDETKCSQEYDDVDFNEYLDKVLVTNFQNLLLSWETQCKLCLDNYNTFEELLRHPCIMDMEQDQHFCCTIKDCKENMDNLSTLARHLILKHCDKLESIQIYGKCPDCLKTFSNIMDFNKHSCCRNIKRKTGTQNYCPYCDMDFQSLKRYVFHMQFHLTNRRPKVCVVCGDLFSNPNDFFEHTQYQHMTKTAMACVKCDRFFKEKEVFDSHMELHEDSKYLYACSLCPKKYTNKLGLYQHKDIYHNNKSNAIQCDHCEKKFVNKSSYRNHVKSHATDVQVESFICSTCGIITNNLEIIKHHIESDEHAPCFVSPIEEKTVGLCYTCENCSLDFLTIKQLKEHRLSPSHSNDLFHCVICHQVFKSLRHMRSHTINHKEFKEWEQSFPITRYFVCNIGECKEFYPIWTTLYYHKKRPHKTQDVTSLPNEFKCQFCQQICSSKMSLAVHIARSHNNSNVKCSYCGRSIKSQKLLQEHIEKYHTPVECEICFKKFKHRRNLESHNNMVHLNLKRFFCKHCEKGYFHKSERDSHEKKVHPRTPYKCEICNFVTNYPESLQIHMDKHNNQLKFTCKVCGKAFGRKQTFQFHLKRHLNRTEYSCSKYLKKTDCAATFSNFVSLKRHVQKKHGNSNYNINLQKENELKRKSNKSNEFSIIDNNSFEILNSDNDSNIEMSSKTSNILPLTDAELEQVDIELVLENDI